MVVEEEYDYKNSIASKLIDFGQFMLVILGAIILGGVVGGIFAGQFVDGKDMLEVMKNYSTDSDRMAMLVAQAVGGFFGFLVGPLAYLKYVKKKSILSITRSTNLSIKNIGLALIIFLLMLPLVAWIAKWSALIPFPESLQKTSDEAFRKTNFITNFSSNTQFYLMFLGAAIMAPIGEELVFRGLLQNKLIRYFGNPHSMIIISSLIFSLFHMEPSGTFTRWILGAILGYAYYYSGSILVPIFLHFVNNAWQLIAIQYGEKMAFEEGLGGIPVFIAIAMFIAGIALFVYFARQQTEYEPFEVF